LPRSRDESRLLYYMGWETANIHLGTVKSRDLRKDFGRRRKDWLEKATARIVEAIKADWRAWRV
jgi:hypothetical protein